MRHHFWNIYWTIVTAVWAGSNLHYCNMESNSIMIPLCLNVQIIFHPETKFPRSDPQASFSCGVVTERWRLFTVMRGSPDQEGNSSQEGVRRNQRRLNWGFLEFVRPNACLSVRCPTDTKLDQHIFKQTESKWNCDFSFGRIWVIHIYTESSYNPGLYVCMFSPFCIYANYFHSDPMQY